MSIRDWWGGLFKRELKDWSWWKTMFPAYFSDNKTIVTAQTSLQASAVYACVRIIAGTIAAMPFVVHEDTNNGKRVAYEHDQFNLLKNKPGSYTSFVFRFNLIMYYLLWGNGYAEVVRNSLGRPIRYVIIPSWQIKVEVMGDQVYYRVENEEGTRVIKAENMIHLFDMSFDGYQGVSRIEFAKENIAMMISSTKFGNKFYENGTFIGGWLEFQKTLKTEDIAKYRTSWKEVNGGMNNVGDVAIIDQGTKYNPHKISMPLSDAQYIESRQFAVAEIARIFNVPPHKIGDLNKSSFNNIEQQAIEFVENCLMPIVVMMEQEFNSKIFRIRETNYYTKVELKGLLRGDITARGEYQSKMFDRGVFSINDIRKLEDMDKVDNGDERFVPLNFTTIEKAIRQEVTEPINNNNDEEGDGDL